MFAFGSCACGDKINISTCYLPMKQADIVAHNCHRYGTKRLQSYNECCRLRATGTEVVPKEDEKCCPAQTELGNWRKKTVILHTT